VFVLHDQLNLDAWPSWIREEKPLLIFIEAAEKGKALPYHKKKLIYLLSSMRHFALECMEAGFPVLYHSTRKHYDDRLSEILSKHEELALTYMTPSEWDSRERVGKVKRQY
ncbi:MAG TPA: cryptochrome/photolyase family protein, partial [Balneolaceae bacterium]|nr:cryptochrome/photolyase family protein [Balneolaceae bacterium]